MTGGGQQEGGKGRGRDAGRGEYGVGESMERGSVGAWDGCRKITVGQGGMKRK